MIKYIENHTHRIYNINMDVYKNFSKNIDDNYLIYLKNISNMCDIVCHNNIYEQYDLLKICDFVINNKFKSVSFRAKFIDVVWKWLEKSNVQLTSFIPYNDYFDNNDLSLLPLFNTIKASYQNGAKLIDISLPNEIVLKKNFDDINRIIDTAIKAVNDKITNLQISFAVNSIKNPDDIFSFLNKLYSFGICNFRTFILGNPIDQFSDITKLSSIYNINTMLDFIKLNNEKRDIKLNIYSAILDDNKFLFVDSVKMLSKSIFSSYDFFQSNISFTFDELTAYKIFQ